MEPELQESVSKEQRRMIIGAAQLTRDYPHMLQMCVANRAIENILESGVTAGKDNAKNLAEQARVSIYKEAKSVRLTVTEWESGQVHFSLGTLEPGNNTHPNEVQLRMLELSNKTADGVYGLKNTEKMLNSPWILGEAIKPDGSRVRVFAASGAFGSEEEMKQSLENLVGVQTKVEEILGKSVYQTEPVSTYYMLPPEFLTRSFYSSGGVVVESGRTDREAVAGHEWTHREMATRYGYCTVNWLTEGMAMVVQADIEGRGLLTTGSPNYAEMKRKLTQMGAKGEPVPLIQSKLDNPGVTNITADGPRSYPYGEWVCGVIRKNYGMDKLLKVYEICSVKQKNLFDTRDGRPLMQNGRVGIDDRERLVEVALTVAGIDPEELRRKLAEDIKTLP